MGLMESLWGEQTPAEGWNVSSNPFRISLRFAPLRLSAMKEGRVDLIVSVQNTTGQSQLVSVDAMLPRHQLVGFDPTCLHKSSETRVGEILPRETKEVRVGIWANNQTKGGDYPLEVHIYSHYLNYNKVINYIKKSATLRVV